MRFYNENPLRITRCLPTYMLAPILARRRRRIVVFVLLSLLLYLIYTVHKIKHQLASRVTRGDRAEDKRIQCHAGARDLFDLNTHTFICSFYSVSRFLFYFIFISNNVSSLLAVRRRRRSKVILSSRTRTTRLQRR